MRQNGGKGAPKRKVYKVKKQYWAGGSNLGVHGVQDGLPEKAEFEG